MQLFLRAQPLGINRGKPLASLPELPLDCLRPLSRISSIREHLVHVAAHDLAFLANIRGHLSDFDLQGCGKRLVRFLPSLSSRSRNLLNHSCGHVPLDRQRGTCLAARLLLVAYRT
ncbi:hypothetical protein DFR24_4350 [Panacagrimonas perspica]|uniref:Uncharacterized protein n=1 Tax=Panacagrimonas perspica TaxID=381431 RepID=A0A4R7NXC5_9GAMM|nr:hypothetical protein DFR24_4350 [Panacagrimonas perspica]